MTYLVFHFSEEYEHEQEQVMLQTEIYFHKKHFAVVPGHPLREVVCYTHAIAAASGATGSDSPYSIVTTR